MRFAMRAHLEGTSSMSFDLPQAAKDVLRERILRKIQIQPNGCWVWPGSKWGQGYGRIYHGQRMSAHRAAYVIWKGAIPSHLQIDHLCRNRACCNPDHLECVTPQVNTLRGVHKSAKVTHCPKGHPYDQINTYVTYRGFRTCRECKKQYRANKRRAA